MGSFVNNREKLKSIEVGMSKAQVKEILGSPFRYDEKQEFETGVDGIFSYHFSDGWIATLMFKNDELVFRPLMTTTIYAGQDQSKDSN